jgi:ABC-type branched-subunit amino acid transport system substrate-binding protein
MTPFLHFRWWLAHGPAGERTITAVVGTVLLALVLWASVPQPQSPDQADALTTAVTAPSASGGAQVQSGPSSAAAPGLTPPGTGSAGAGGAGVPVAGGGGTTGPVRAGGSGAAVGGGASAGAPGQAACGPLTATDNGVTAKDITVGVVVVDLGGASGVINLPTPEEVKRAYNAAIDDVNARGGVRCRKLKAKFYNDSVFDTSQEHAACLQMAADKVFTVFNNFFTTAESTCVAKQKIPNIWYGPPHTPDVKRYSPYILTWHAHYDQLIKHYVHGAKAQGWFKGMKKLGLLEQSCYADENDAIRRELQSIGLKVSDVSLFNYGCDATPVDPSKDQAAALQFKRDGVTHVMNVAYTYDANFSVAADQQNYDPEFAHMEDASATAIEAQTQKPGRSYDGTLLITAIETGANHTPGYRYNKASQDCAAVMKKAGLPAPYAEPKALFFGIACVNVAMFKDAADNAPSLVRTQLATGLSRIGAKELPYPASPAVFDDPQLPTGGQQWRPGKWVRTCQCWQVIDPRYRPGY